MKVDGGGCVWGRREKGDATKKTKPSLFYQLTSNCGPLSHPNLDAAYVDTFHQLMTLRCAVGRPRPPPPRRVVRAATEVPPPSDAFDYALRRARECIFEHPRGQLQGRAGERCTVEDGERHARRAATLRPADPHAATLVVTALSLQRGREDDAVAVAADALARCDGLRAGPGAAAAARAVAAAALGAVKRRGGDVAAAGRELAAAAAEGVRGEVGKAAGDV